MVCRACRIGATNLGLLCTLRSRTSPPDTSCLRLCLDQTQQLLAIVLRAFLHVWWCQRDVGMVTRVGTAPEPRGCRRYL